MSRPKAALAVTPLPPPTTWDALVTEWRRRGHRPVHVSIDSAPDGDTLYRTQCLHCRAILGLLVDAAGNTLDPVPLMTICAEW